MWCISVYSTSLTHHLILLWSANFLVVQLHFEQVEMRLSQTAEHVGWNVNKAWMEIRKAWRNTVSLYTVVLCSELCREEFGFWICGRRVHPLFLMGQNDVKRYNLLPPLEFYSAMPAFFCISLVIQETNYKQLVVVVYFRERIFLSSTTSAWSPWIFMSSTLFTLWVLRRLDKITFWRKWALWQSGKVVQVFFQNAFNFRNTQTVFTNAAFLKHWQVQVEWSR